MSPDSVDFMKSLMKVKVVSRLGSGREGTNEIMLHPWLKDIDWNALAVKRVKPFFVPSPDYIKNATADFNDSFSTRENNIMVMDERLDEPQPWIEGF